MVLDSAGGTEGFRGTILDGPATLPSLSLALPRMLLGVIRPPSRCTSCRGGGLSAPEGFAAGGLAAFSAPVAPGRSKPLGAEGAGSVFTASLASGDVGRMRDLEASGCRSPCRGPGADSLIPASTVSFAFALPFRSLCFSKKAASACRCPSTNLSPSFPPLPSVTYAVQHSKRYRLVLNSALKSPSFLAWKISLCVDFGQAKKRESLKEETYNGTLHASHDFNDGAIANGSVDGLVGVVDSSADLFSSGEWHVWSAVDVIEAN